MKKKITYYDILGVAENSSTNEIKAAYRQKAKEVHPDISGDSTITNKKMALLNKTYQTLINPLSRQEYDHRIKKINISSSQRRKQKNYSSVVNADTKDNSEEPVVYNKAKSKNPGSNWGIMILIIFLILGVNIFSQIKTNSNTLSPGITPTTTNNSTGANTFYTAPTVNAEPTIDCIGPDGKHLALTQKACDDFNNAWRPTATPTSPQSNDSLNQDPQPTIVTSCGLNSHISSSFCVCDTGYSRDHNIGVCEKHSP